MYNNDQTLNFYPPIGQNVLEECKIFSNFLLCFIRGEGEGERKRTFHLSKVNWYRVAQSAELALPRCYLLLCVSRAYLSLEDGEFSRLFLNLPGIETKEALIDDLRLSCLAIGDSIKGLALRDAILCEYQMFLDPKKDEKHDYSSTIMSNSSSLEKNIDVLLEEFSIVNRLWVRLRFNAGESQEIIRRQLEQIVAHPIKILATLKGLTREVYSELVLSLLLKHVIGCRDNLAQEFLTEVILEAFPVSFNLFTIEKLLDAVSQFNMTVDIRRLVNSIINHILHSQKGNTELEGGGGGDNVEFGGNSPSLFDGLWERVSYLLNNRVETLRVEEVIILCTSLLHHALNMKPFKAERVERILNFIYKSTEQQETTSITIGGGGGGSEGQESLAVSKIIDIVLEFIPRGDLLFAIPSLFKLLSNLNSIMAASCGLCLIGRLVKDQVLLLEEWIPIFNKIVLISIQGEGEGGGKDDGVADEKVELNDCIDRVRILENVSQNVFNSVLPQSGPERMIKDGYFIINNIIESGNLLAALIFTPKAVNSWLLTKAGNDKIRTTLQNLKRLSNQKKVQPTISWAQFEASRLEDKSSLSMFLYDSVSLVLVLSWGRCIEVWKDSMADSIELENLIYEAIVECILILEEEVTDHHSQCDILSAIIRYIGEAKEQHIQKNDLSVLVEKLYLNTKRLIKIEERKTILFALLRLAVKLGNRLDIKIVLKISEALLRIIPFKPEHNSSLTLIVSFNRLLVDYMLVSSNEEDGFTLGKIVYDHLARIETISAQMLIEPLRLRQEIDELLNDWKKIKLVSSGRPSSSSYGEEVVVSLSHPIGNEESFANQSLASLVIDDGPLTTATATLTASSKVSQDAANAFSTFHPDFANF